MEAEIRALLDDIECMNNAEKLTIEATIKLKLMAMQALALAKIFQELEGHHASQDNKELWKVK